MVINQHNPPTVNSEDSLLGTLGDRMQSGGAGAFISVPNDFEPPLFEKEEINVPGVVLPGDKLRLSNTPEAMPELIATLRKMRGMTQAELGAAISYPASAISNTEPGVLG